MTQVRMVPVDVVNGAPKDVGLYRAVQVYSEKEFGAGVEVSYYHRVWAVVALKEEEPEYMEVIGLMGARNVIDWPLFHVTPLTQDKAGLKLAEQARDMMVARGRNYIEDLGMRGTSVLIFVSEQGQRYWRRFLKKIGALPANRFELKI